MNLSGKIAIVTGASAGIGAALVQDLAKSGAQVIGIARRVERIVELAATCEGPGHIHAMQCDLSKPDSIEAVFAKIKAKFGKIHILVNNAGRTIFGSTLSPDVPTQELINTINVNLTSVLVCTREAFKLINNHNEPAYIMNVNSVVGHMTPTVSSAMRSNIYSATKHAITNHTETVRLELAGADNKRVRVTSISPGVVSTEFISAAGISKEVFDVSKMVSLSGQDVSNAIMYLLTLPEHINISELTIKATGEKL